jgi:hypothetical protein
VTKLALPQVRPRPGLFFLDLLPRLEGIARFVSSSQASSGAAPAVHVTTLDENDEERKVTKERKAERTFSAVLLKSLQT